MEWFFSFFDKIAASYLWKTVFAQFGWVDWFTFCLIIIGLVYGAQNGMMREVVEIVQTIVLVFVVLHFHPHLEKFFKFHFMKLPSAVAPMLAFILLSAGTLTVIYAVDRHFRKLLKADQAPLLRVAGGALLGVAHIIILWSFMAQLLVMIPARPLQRAFEKGNSVTGHAVLTLTPRAYTFLSNPAQVLNPEKEKKKPS